MKVNMIMFQITKVGGIATGQRQLKKALQELGHDVTHYFLSNNKSILPKSIPHLEFVDEILGYMNDKMLDNAINKLKDADLLIFDPPCPTITKSYTTRRWQEFYKNTELPEHKIGIRKILSLVT